MWKLIPTSTWNTGRNENRDNYRSWQKPKLYKETSVGLISMGLHIADHTWILKSQHLSVMEMAMTPWVLCAIVLLLANAHCFSTASGNPQDLVSGISPLGVWDSDLKFFPCLPSSSYLCSIVLMYGNKRGAGRKEKPRSCWHILCCLEKQWKRIPPCIPAWSWRKVQRRIDKLTTVKVQNPHFIDDLPSIHQKVPIFWFCVVLEVWCGH